MTDTAVSVDKLTTADLLEAMYGSIQDLVEGGEDLDNFTFHYFLPPIPFGPELAAFMDIGRSPKGLDSEEDEEGPRFNSTDLIRAAVNLAVMADYLPTIDQRMTTTADMEDDVPVVSLNSLTSSGRTISNIYNAVLQNCKVIDNTPSEEQLAELDEVRAKLFRDPEVEEGDDVDEFDVNDDGDIDPSDFLTDDLVINDIVEDSNALGEPTKLMQLYQVLETRYIQVRNIQLQKLREIHPDDPNAGNWANLLRQQIRAAEDMWKTQGRKSHVEGLFARYEQLSRAGMPGYVRDLRERLAANRFTAQVFTSVEFGVGDLGEHAYYTALRPNGILRAPTMMKITLDSSEAEHIENVRKRATSVRGAGILKAIPLFGNAGGKKTSTEIERRFFSEGFTIEYEIVQGTLDRPWLDLAFLESGAYTTIEPGTDDKPLDLVNDIVTLSDGENPPNGAMPLIPTTAYFVRNLKVTSNVFKSMSKTEQDEFSRKGGVWLLGFGITGDQTSKTSTPNWSHARSSGTIEMDGVFLIGYGSRILDKAPNPNFEDYPNAEDWI